MTRMEPLRWLLSDSTIMTEPALEMTGTGAKVRVAGTTNSVYASRLDELLKSAAEAAAKERGVNVWLPLPNGKADQVISEIATRSQLDLNREAVLHFISQPGATNVNTLAYWRFKDPHSPFEVVLSAILHTAYNGVHSMATRLAFPYRDTNHWDPFQVVAVNTDNFSEVVTTLSTYDQNAPYAWGEFIRDNPEPLPVALQIKTLPNPRAAVTALHQVVQALEATDTIKVPFLADPGTPSWRELELYATNVSGQFKSDLAEYLDGSPTVDQAVSIYQDLLGVMKSIGLNPEGKSNNDFMSALLAGDKVSINVRVSPLSDLTDNGVLSEDHDHTLDIHLPTGTFIVNCSRGEDAARSAAADHWEEAKVKASLTGELPELLAFARRDVERKHGDRSKRIMKARK